MRHCIYILFLLITLICNGQNYKLELTFEPSFIERADIIINYNENQASTISIKNFYIDEKRIIENKQLEQLSSILENYKFKHSNSIKENTVIKNGDTITLTTVGLDGVTVSGILKKEKNYKSFAFWSPNRESPNGKLIECLFSLFDSSFQENNTVRYLDALKGSFSGYPSPKNKNSHIEFMIREDIYMVVEKMPEFYGGKDSLDAYIKKNIDENEVISLSKLTGKVYVGFIIDELGNVLDTKILRGLTPDIDKECLNIVAKMPKWIPGEQYDNKVKVSYRIKIKIE